MAETDRSSRVWITGLLGELGRRKVFQVAAVYAVVAWLIIQVVSAVREPLRLPEWLDAVVIVLLGAGFPIALIFAWAFDLTPRGIEPATSVRGPGPAIPKLTYVTHGLVLLAVGFLLVDQYLPERRLGILTVPASTPAAAGAMAHLDHPLRRYDLDLGLDGTIGNTGLSSHLAFSSDGTRLVYAANRDDVSRLYVRYLDQIGEQALAGTDGAQHPFFSPDGEWVAYFADETARKLMKISLRGGRPQSLADSTYSGQGSWHLPGEVVFGAGNDNIGRNLYRVSAAGGVPELVLASNAEAGYVQPEVLPGEAALLFTVRPGNGGIGSADTGNVTVLRFDSGEQRRLVERAHTPRYAPTGHIVFVRDETLWAVPFDAERLETTGAEVPIVAGVQEDGLRGGAAFAFSSDGLLAYVPTDGAKTTPTRSTPIWVDRSGREVSLGIEPEDFGGWSLSPDGDRLAVVRNIDGNADLWIRDIARGIWSRRLTFDAAQDYHPIWSPDGKRVYYGSEVGEGLEIRAVGFDGTNLPERVLSSRTWIVPEGFAPDGHQLFVAHVVGGFDIEIVSLPTGTTNPLIATSFNEASARISHDGRWLAYSSNETETTQVYVRPFPNVQDGKWTISGDGGEDPSWDPHGRELYFCSDIGLMVVSLEQPEPSFEGIPRPLISTVDTDLTCGTETLDGQRFLMTKVVDAPAEEPRPEPSPRVIFVEHWFDELTRLAPPAEPAR